MPSIARQYKTKPIAHLRRIELSHRVIEYRLVEILTRAIQLFEFAGDDIRFVFALGEQQ